MQSTGGTLRTLVVTTALLAGACSSESTILEAGDAPPATGPPTTEGRPDDGAARDAVETQVLDAQILIDRLYEDPELAQDSDDTTLQGVLDAHTPTSPRIDAMLDELDELAADGLHRELHRDTNLTRTHILVYNMEVSDPETVDFRYCLAMDVVTVDEEGEEQEGEDLSLQELGVGRARLIDGEWLIDSWEEEDTIDGFNPGGVHPRECELYGLEDSDDGQAPDDSEEGAEDESPDDEAPPGDD